MSTPPQPRVQFRRPGEVLTLYQLITSGPPCFPGGYLLCARVGESLNSPISGWYDALGRQVPAPPLGDRELARAPLPDDQLAALAQALGAQHVPSKPALTPSAAKLLERVRNAGAQGFVPMQAPGLARASQTNQLRALARKRLIEARGGRYFLRAWNAEARP